MNKISQYFSTLELTRGLGIALLASAFIYLAYWGLSSPLLNTVLAVLSLYLLLESHTKTWFIAGALISLFWFWWIVLSLIQYNMLWAAPLVLLLIMLIYGLLFTFIAWFAEKTPITLVVKALGLFTLSFIHPFGFDWFKPELMFVESYLGIDKLHFAIILLTLALTLWRKQLFYLVLLVFAYTPLPSNVPQVTPNMTLLTTHTLVQDKWEKVLHPAQFKVLFKAIDKAIKQKKSLIVLPESVFPLFLNLNKTLLKKLKEKSKTIGIVTGSLYWDGKTPRNTAYIFTHGEVKIANKVLMVPFGEANPLPDFLSDWVNEVFYDDAVDYKADANVTDYSIDGITYRNAICFEATSEKLYEKGVNEKRPEQMIVLSNNGWFVPSIEPTLQRLLLQYYSKKYGTTIYHAINMSESYIIQEGKRLDMKRRSLK